ncbi:hypothetical protein KCV03_g376, partial [Aureobasidium melanogenum]
MRETQVARTSSGSDNKHLYARRSTTPCHTRYHIFSRFKRERIRSRNALAKSIGHVSTVIVVSCHPTSMIKAERKPAETAHSKGGVHN